MRCDFSVGIKYFMHVTSVAPVRRKSGGGSTDAAQNAKEFFWSCTALPLFWL